MKGNRDRALRLDKFNMYSISHNWEYLKNGIMSARNKYFKQTIF